MLLHVDVCKSFGCRKTHFEHILGKFGVSDDPRIYMHSVIRLALALELLGSEGYQCLAGNDFYLSVA